MIQMPWFLPLGLFIGTLLSQAAVQRLRDAKRNHRSKNWWILLVVGWLPLLAWIVSQWVPQY